MRCCNRKSFTESFRFRSYKMNNTNKIETKIRRLIGLHSTKNDTMHSPMLTKSHKIFFQDFTEFCTAAKAKQKKKQKKRQNQSDDHRA